MLAGYPSLVRFFSRSRRLPASQRSLPLGRGSRVNLSSVWMAIEMPSGSGTSKRAKAARPVEDNGPGTSTSEGNALVHPVKQVFLIQHHYIKNLITSRWQRNPGRTGHWLPQTCCCLLGLSREVVLGAQGRIRISPP